MIVVTSRTGHGIRRRVSSLGARFALDEVDKIFR